MVDYLPIPSTRGRLFYVPEARFAGSDRPQQVFRARTPRAQSLRIAHIRHHWEDTLALDDSRGKRSVITGKLAVTREGARKLLRRINNPDNPAKATADPSPRPSRRGSLHLLGATGTSPPSSGEEGGPPPMARTESARRGSRPSPPPPDAAAAGILHRPTLSDSVRTASDRSTTSVASGRTMSGSPLPSDDRPVASGNGVVVWVNLAEPVLFLQGFESSDVQAGNTAMLRGSLVLNVQKAAKIKAVTLRFRGKATTKWPEGIPPKKLEFEETDNIMSHTWPFFNAQFPTAEAGSCADRVELRREPTAGSNLRSSVSACDDDTMSPAAPSTNLSNRDARKLSLQVNQSRSFGKGESSTSGPSVAQKGYRTFQPGNYTYNFELPLDSRLPETIDVDLGSVRYDLEAVIERSGAFRANLVGSKEVQLIRAPAEGSLEQVEPIAISRNWEDQLHYDIVISGKSFPMGSQVPIAFKLTPLAKVQCHRIKVFVTENIEYFCSNKRVHRMEPVRKLQLFEKRADSPPTSTFPGSTMRVTAGGGIPYDLRAAAARGENVATADPTNLLGRLEGEPNAGPTEMEFNVQLPSCTSNTGKDRAPKLHFDTTYQNIQVHHWIKIVMRLSRPDPNDPTRRRHFEISIDSPFHILSCRASQANTALPAYSGPAPGQGNQVLAECGCPGAATRRHSPTSFVPTLSSLQTSLDGTTSPTAPSSSVSGSDSNSSLNQPVHRVDTFGLTRPPAAHTHGASTSSTASAASSARFQTRPIHLMRAPSFNPPAFDDDMAPPPLVTPPPQYDTIASPTSGLADYFARLSDAYEDDDEPSDRISRSRSRVDVPLTPGSTRVNRSMDEPRTWLPVGQNVA